MFDDIPAPLARKPRTVQSVSWTKCATQARCQDCQKAQHAGAAILARKAQMRRRTSDTDQMLCYEHAIPYRDADEAIAKKEAITK